MWRWWTKWGGRLVGFRLTPGNAHEPHSLSALLEGIPANELIADKAYDTNAALALLAERDITAVIPPRANRQAPRQYDSGVYGMRHFVENRFAAVPSKEFRGIATRYCKRSLMYGGMLNLVRRLWLFARRCRAVRRAAVPQSIGGWHCDAISSFMSARPRACRHITLAYATALEIGEF